MSVTQSPPSASITATSRSTRPGSCAERRSRVPANASDNAVGQPDPIGQLDQQRDARVRHQPLSVRRHFYRSKTSLWLHQLGVLLGRGSRSSAIPILTAREDVPATRRQPAIGASRLRLHRPRIVASKR